MPNNGKYIVVRDAQHVERYESREEAEAHVAKMTTPQMRAWEKLWSPKPSNWWVETAR